MKKTPVTHPDHSNLEVIAELLQQANEDIDERLKQEEVYEKKNSFFLMENTMK